MQSFTILAVALFSLFCHGQRFPIPGARDVQQPCVDLSNNCVTWAESYCNPGSLYYDYMKKNCRKSCGLCTPGNSRISPIEPIRQDCSRVMCDIPICNRGHIPITKEGDCCPSCVPISSRPSVPIDPVPVHQDCSRVRCMMITCTRDQIRTQGEGDCCPKCIPIPSKGCKPVYRQVHLTGANYQGYQCDTVAPLLASSCYGVCSSSSVLLFSGKEYNKCQCCKSDHTRTTSALLTCRKPHSHQTTQLLFEYEIILSCSCQDQKCPPWGGPTDFAAVPGTIPGSSQSTDSDKAAMNAFNDMFDRIDNYERA